ncbi:hypothetical protein K457DRAFT_501101 [Linnemannia elongata AG-77]|uniref:Uncharacterized protein n=1 Tax=Linnemannia elongata AG-77 TaxID=1314771 RepID=A0A197JYK9_9FUNG|nr:hypothetical protein K457DRAFT_501101 [Linnemannia elongata AG-77]
MSLLAAIMSLPLSCPFHLGMLALLLHRTGFLVAATVVLSLYLSLLFATFLCFPRLFLFNLPLTLSLFLPSPPLPLFFSRLFIFVTFRFSFLFFSFL